MLTYSAHLFCFTFFWQYSFIDYSFFSRLAVLFLTEKQMFPLHYELTLNENGKKEERNSDWCHEDILGIPSCRNAVRWYRKRDGPACGHLTADLMYHTTVSEFICLYIHCFDSEALTVLLVFFFFFQLLCMRWTRNFMSCSFWFSFQFDLWVTTQVMRQSINDLIFHTHLSNKSFFFFFFWIKNIFFAISQVCFLLSSSLNFFWWTSITAMSIAVVDTISKSIRVICLCTVKRMIIKSLSKLSCGCFYYPTKMADICILWSAFFYR